MTSGFALLALVLAAVLLGMVGGALLVRHRLASLRKGILQAQDGVLEPVAVPAGCNRFLSGLYDDYNRMMVTLGGMFSFVEDCQTRFLSERNKMNVIVQGLPVALLSFDDNLHINTANKQAEALFLRAAHELVGRSLFDILALNEGDRAILRDAFLYKQNIRNQVIHMNVGGTERWLTVNLSFVTDQESDMAAVITLLDITDYKHLQDSAYNREKLVSMGQLAAGVAHELNTPLGSILGYSQLLLDAGGDPGKVESHAAIIKEEARRCSRIVHNLLSYARKEQCQGESCEVNTLIDEIVETFITCRLKRESIEVVRELDPVRPVAEGGCGELDIVLTNLLINAIQALRGRPNPRILIRTGMERSGWIRISVEDNGPGIGPELRTRIFEPFFTTKDVGEGSGLGLSISHAMLSRRGGIIRYDSDYSDGARFVVKLPALGVAEPATEQSI